MNLSFEKEMIRTKWAKLKKKKRKSTGRQYYGETAIKTIHHQFLFRVFTCTVNGKFSSCFGMTAAAEEAVTTCNFFPASLDTAATTVGAATAAALLLVPDAECTAAACNRKQKGDSVYLDVISLNNKKF